MSRLCLSLPVLLVLFLWPDHAIAQQDQGTISGLVIDATGALIPRAAVAASAIDTQISTQTVTNSEGLYAFAALKIGRYRISVEMQGFKRGVSDVVEVHLPRRLAASS